MDFTSYDPAPFYDEMFEPEGRPRTGCDLLARTLAALPGDDLMRRQRSAERALLHMGITFNVYGHEHGTEKILPFDLVPRVVSAREWAPLEKGLAQRSRALNLFIDDVYHARRIVADGVVPRELIESASALLAGCRGLDPPRGVWAHVTGTDLVRDSDGRYYVLEDNLRCPSGVSYVLHNRQVMKRTFPKVFQESRVRPVDGYPGQLLRVLQNVRPRGVATPNVVVLTPGPYNSAYSEHSFLAQQMGVELVESRDLAVRDGFVWMRTTRGLARVDVVYRRVDETYLDPTVFRPDSMLGVPGLMSVVRAGRLTLVNAPGTGVADDKVIYAYVPAIIRYYLGEDAILPNVPTFVCYDDKQRAHVLANLDKLVVKAANESGGYGMLIGPQASTAERAAFADRIRAQPRNYIAQPLLGLSRVPTIVGDSVEGRHVDLRPYILHAGDDVFVLPGGLTRVALKKGSFVVNSSQGGGTKDTWVLADGAAVREALPC
ncbi:MAG TPA: circularly permuted type 2 ATP-grasp protein [Polyangiaceae bacterium]|nr:circularly permuted type 2 ATP-grasp protein [Polyangiaceae bacterium]